MKGMKDKYFPLQGGQASASRVTKFERILFVDSFSKRIINLVWRILFLFSPHHLSIPSPHSKSATTVSIGVESSLHSRCWI